MTRIKICGITNAEDALLAAELGAFAVGFIFWPGSPRCVTAAAARAIVDVLPAAMEKVGVFVDQPVDVVHAIGVEAALTALQLHGVENAVDYQNGSRRVMKAIAIRGDEDAERAAALPETVLPLLDAHDPIKRGGTGRTIDWTVAARVSAVRPVVLSGGLHAGNVVEAVRAVRPYAIDVSSGVEQAPGTKDPAKLRAFFEAVRNL